jgi:hypothetical protein
VTWDIGGLATMGDVVDLQTARLENDAEFVADLCRFSERILTETQVRKKWRLPDDVWEKLGSNDVLVEKIELEKVRRIRDGSSKREKAQLLVVQAPDVAAAILMDPGANPRHRLDSAKILDDFATGGPAAAAAASDRFIIQINLGTDVDGKPVVENYDKSIAIDVNDEAKPTPQKLSPRVIPHEPGEDYGG